MHISTNRKYCRITTPCLSFEISKRTVCFIGLAVAAYNIQPTRAFIKPLCDFAVSYANTLWYHKVELLGLVCLYMVMKYTGLLKACRDSF